MTYTPYLIANFATGVDKRLQPWLSPEDAQQDLYDGYVYRGTMSKREGYNYFATGELGGSAYRESRIVTLVTAAPAVQVPNGAILTFTLAGTGPIARGSVTVNGSNPVVVGTDDGLGLIGSITGTGITSGTVNYTTGALSVTFTVAPVLASTVTFTYSYMQDQPVMMVASFYTSTNSRQLIAASTTRVNRYNPTLNILEDITVTPYTGQPNNFFSWTNYPDANYEARLIFTNNKDVVQRYNGTNVANYAYTMNTSPTAAVPVPVAVTTFTALLTFEFKDRLLFLRTNENGTIYPRRIRISGTGLSSDVFDSTAIGAGFIDIPDNTWIMGAAFNRDDLIIFTENSTWTLKYTGNDTTPFVLNKIDESRGSQAPFAAITYLNRTSACSPRGLIMTDGYRVERQDESIPDYSFNEISSSTFDLSFAGSVDADRDHYLIHPQQGQTSSSRILVTNYDEDNYSVYRLPLSCMGTFIASQDETWTSLLKFKNWKLFSAQYGNWNSFAYSSKVPISLGGGHHGEIWQLAVTEMEDNPVKIRNITVIDSETLQVTTDWNNYGLNPQDDTLGADYIFITGVSGMVEINDQQYPITSRTNNYIFNIAVNPNVSYSAFDTTSIGEAVRVIPFSSTMKQFNPFIQMDKKVRCGWIYMYVDSTGTDLNKLIGLLSVSQSDPCIVVTDTAHNLISGDQVSFIQVGGMTELNNNYYFITVINPTSFSLNDIDSTAFTAYTSGGYVKGPERAKIDIQVYTNDRDPSDDTQYDPVTNQYKGTCTNLTFEDGNKKWYKVYINQIGKFVQFKLLNQQAGSKINIQAFMPGFQAVGRVI